MSSTVTAKGLGQDHERLISENQNLKHELFNKTTALEQAFTAIDKAALILDHWTQTYIYNNKPQPNAAIAWGSGRGKGPYFEQSAQWYVEYEYITKYVDIAHDYVHNAKEELARILKD